jgi:polysaccharide chain length determinant protein (PEP-CTERM system associated)
VNDIFLLVYGFARAAWRRRKLAMLAAWAVALAIWMVTLGLKDRYQASARVLVDVRTPLQQVIKGMSIESDYAAQLARVRELLLSRPQIEAVARKTNLDKDVGSDPAKMDALVSRLGKEIVVFATAAGGAPPGGNTNTAATDSVYNIIYQHSDRDKSVEVVRELLNSFEEGTTLGNRDGANEAQKFLDKQIEEANKKLKEQEDLISEFQKRNLSVLPGKNDYFVRYAQEQSGLQEAETSLAVAQGRQNALNAQLASTPQYLAGSSTGGAPDVTVRRQEAEKEYERKSLVYTDENPEMIELKKTIETLRAREAKELADLATGGKGSGDTTKTVNPNWQQISAALSQLQGDIAAIRAAATQHKREIARLEGDLDQTPAIQQEYVQLTRNYATDKLQYEQLLQKKQQANISDDAAESGIARFEVLDPPRADPAPVWPSRPLFILGGLFAALGAGLVLGLLPHLLAPTVNDVAALERQFGLPVLGTVSALRDVSVEHRERYAVRNTVFGVGALVVFAAFLVVFSDTIANMIRH